MNHAIKTEYAVSILVLFFVTCWSSEIRDDSINNLEQIKVLIPDAPISFEEILPNGWRYYKIKKTDLVPSSSYEVRISYLATNPTNWEIEFVHKQSTQRKLLNIEKIMFETNEEGEIENTDYYDDNKHEYLIKATAHFACVTTDPAVEKTPFQYNIETLFYGAPYEVFKIGIIVGVGVVVASIIIPQLYPFLHASVGHTHEH